MRQQEDYAMPTVTAPGVLWTAADLLGLPDDGVERWIIRGQLREKQPEFPCAGCFVRGRREAAVLTNIGGMLVIWVRSCPRPHGAVYAGRAGVWLHRDPDTVIGADVVYCQPDMVASQDDKKTTLIDGVPTLVVEILSPNDTQAQIKEKVKTYRDAGVPLVWVIDPDDRTVTVYRPGQPVATFNDTQQLPVYPEMPGFAPAVAELFE
jgi:Uma2 family endonuclease